MGIDVGEFTHKKHFMNKVAQLLTVCLANANHFYYAKCTKVKQ
jgi:hypothetical protein